MKYGYVRIIAEGQMIEDQVQALLGAGVDIIYKEKYTSEATYRPVFERLLNTLGPQDVIVVTKFSGFARNTHEALEVMQVLFNRKVAINILDVGLVDETPTGKLIFTVFSAFAKFEREMILTRTQEGKNMHENIIPIIEKDVNAYIVMHNRIRLQMENL